MKYLYFGSLLLCSFLLCSFPVKKTGSSNQAIISFVFDDLNASDALVKDIFDEFHFQPSFALQSNKLDAKTAPLYQSYSKEGISILSHSHTHLRMQDPDKTAEQEVQFELMESKEIIEGYGIPVKGFVTPYSKMHPDFLPHLYPSYEYAFTTSKDLFDHTVNKLQLSRYGIEGNISTSDHSIQKIERRIDQAIEKKELLVLYGHALPSTYLDDSGKPRVNANDLRAILRYLKTQSDKNECQVLPSDMAIAMYYR